MFVRVSWVTVSILLAGAFGSTASLHAQGGYWLRTGKVEYLSKKEIGTVGTIQQTMPSGWNVTYDVDDTSITSTSKFGKSTVVVRVTWGARPLVIIPGEVIPVGGEVKVVTVTGPGISETRVDLLCQLLGSKIELDDKKKEVEKMHYIQELFPETNFIMVIGKSGATVSKENTKVVLGEPGKNYKSQSPIYIRYVATTGYGNSYSIAYQYVWHDGPVPESTLNKMKEELEAIKKKKEQDTTPLGKDDVPDDKPSPTPGTASLIDASGTWTIYSLGEVGTADEKNVHYTGTLVFMQNTQGGYTGSVNFGTVEKLSDVALKEGVLHFSRTLSGVTQKYTGKATDAGISGTFTHNNQTFAWRAEKAAPKKDQ